MLAEPRCRLIRLAEVKAQIGYKRRPGIYGGRPKAATNFESIQTVHRFGDNHDRPLHLSTNTQIKSRLQSRLFYTLP
ncbi:hypothetical protein [Agrobacterium sp. B1(2019)]|uniref:hypothetical protein n=1 Tax=Agrobacterium sp. B1(2019) TaxID=2607032 RepID=UPI0016597C04|nr:hypothetical protein [Agrobacterium sp. B1(2019)]